MDYDEYERLKAAVGVDFDIEGQECINLVVKSIIHQGLPMDWVRETDLNENVMYFNKITKEVTYVHPRSKQLRLDFQEYFKHKEIIKKRTKQTETNVILSESSQRQLEFQKKWAEKEKKRLEQKLHQQSLKVVMGSSTAKKLLQSKMEQAKPPVDLIQSLVFADTRSEFRLRKLNELSKEFKKRVYDEVYTSFEEFNSIMDEAFYYYHKKFTKILSDTNIFNALVGNSRRQSNEGGVNQDDELVPDLPSYINQNTYFQTVTLEELIDMANYYNIDPSSQYYLMWIPRLALALKIPPYWTAICEQINEKGNNNKSFRHLVSNLVIRFHPSDPYVRYLVQIVKQSQKVTSQNHFKNFEMKSIDNIGREYDYKQQFCELLGIDNIIKHSIHVKLIADQQKSNKQQSSNWIKQQEQKKSLDPEQQQNNAVKEQYDNFTDAEIFAIAVQCGIDLETEMHLLNFLVMITAQVKSTYKTNLEFRFIKDYQQPTSDQRQQRANQNEHIFYWRDSLQDKNHRVFPLLGEVKQRLDVLKGNLNVLEQQNQFKNFYKDLDRYKKIFKGNPLSLRDKVQTEKHLLVEQYLTQLLEKGRIDPLKFLFSQQTKSGKGFFKISQEDIDRIFHLLGNKVKFQEIIDFCFTSPFKFEMDEEDEKIHKQILDDLEKDDLKFRISQLKNRINSNHDDFQDVQHELKVNAELAAKRRHQRRSGIIQKDENIKQVQDKFNKKDLNYLLSQPNEEEKIDKYEEDDDEDDIINKLIRKRKNQSNEDLDQLALKYGEERIKAKDQGLKKMLEGDQNESNDSTGKNKKGISNDDQEISKKDKMKGKISQKTRKPSDGSSNKASSFKIKMVENGKENNNTKPQNEDITNELQKQYEQQKKSKQKKQIIQQALKQQGGLKGHLLKQKNKLYDVKAKNDNLDSKDEIRKLLEPKASIMEEVDLMFSNNNRSKRRPRKQLKKQETKEDKQSPKNNSPSNKGNNLKLEELKILPTKLLNEKLTGLLEEVEKMTLGIQTLIQQPTGSNPLVSKLADIIYTTNIDIESFVTNLEVESEQNDTDVLKKLIQHIQSTHDQKIKKVESLEEAAHLAEHYFNMMARKKSKGLSSKDVNDQEDINYGNNGGGFLESQKKLEIYDRLVKALFRMTKKRIQEFNIKVDTHQQESLQRRGSVGFNNFVHIKSKNQIEKNGTISANPNKDILLQDYQQKLDTFSSRLSVHKIQMGKSGYRLRRVNDLIEDNENYKDLIHKIQQSNFKMKKSPHGSSKYFGLEKERINKSENDLKVDSETETTNSNDASDDIEEEQTEGKPVQRKRNRRLTLLEQKKILKNKIAGINSDLKSIITKDLQHTKIIEEDDWIQQTIGGFHNNHYSNNKQEPIQSGVLLKNGYQQPQNNAQKCEVNILPYLQKVKFHQRNLSTDVQWTNTIMQKTLSQRFFQPQTPRVIIDQESQSIKTPRQSEARYQTADQKAAQLFLNIQEKRDVMKYYKMKIGDPLLHPKYLKTNEIINSENIPINLKPDHVVQLGQQLGIRAEDDPIRSKLRETDMMWIPYLLLVTELPSDLKFDPQLKSLIEKHEFDNLLKEPMKLHPGFEYFKMLKMSNQNHRNSYLTSLKTTKERFNSIKECSWLCFKEKRVYHSESPDDYNLYYYNFFTKQKTYMVPSTLMKIVEYHQTDKIPDNPNYYRNPEDEEVEMNRELRDLEILEQSVEEVIQKKINENQDTELGQSKLHSQDQIKILKHNNHEANKFMYKRLRLQKSAFQSLNSLQTTTSDFLRSKIEETTIIANPKTNHIPFRVPKKLIVNMETNTAQNHFTQTSSGFRTVRGSKQFDDFLAIGNNPILTSRNSFGGVQKSSQRSMRTGVGGIMSTGMMTPKTSQNSPKSFKKQILSPKYQFRQQQ